MIFAGIDHLHFNYYTRGIEDLIWDDIIPNSGDTDHPMKLLPYDNSSAPFSPTDTWVATGSDNSSITTIQFDVETPYNEMDLNALTLWIYGNTFETNFGERINFNTGDSDSGVHTQTTEISTDYGTIDLQITVFNFNTPNDHTIRFKYDLTNYYGSNNSSFPSDAISVDIKDIEYFTTISGFSAEHE